MTEQEFDDLLRESSETPRQLPYEQEAWQQLAGRLDAVQAAGRTEDKDVARPILLPAWWLLLLLPLLAWNFYLQHTLQSRFSKEASRQALSGRAPGAENTGMNPAGNRQPVIVRDTVWLFASKSWGTATNQRWYPDARSGSVPYTTAFKSHPDTIFIDKIPSNLNGATTNTWSAGHLPPILPLRPPGLNIPPRVNLLQVVDPFSLLPTRAMQQPQLRQLGGQLGLGGSYNGGFNAMKSGWIIREYGLEASLQWGRRIGLVAGLSSASGNFTAAEDQLPQPMPQAQPQNPGDQIHHVSAQYEWISMPVGLKWTFLPGKKVRPAISGGLEPVWLREADFEYEYKSLSGAGGEYTDRFEQHFSGNSESNRVWLVGSLQGPLWRDWYWMAQAGARLSAGASRYLPAFGTQPWFSLSTGYRWTKTTYSLKVN